MVFAKTFFDCLYLCMTASGGYFISELEKAVNVWSGKLYIKTTGLTDVIIKCYASEITKDLPLPR